MNKLILLITYLFFYSLIIYAECRPEPQVPVPVHIPRLTAIKILEVALKLTSCPAIEILEVALKLTSCPEAPNSKPFEGGDACNSNCWKHQAFSANCRYHCEDSWCRCSPD